MLWALMGRVNNTQEQMYHISRETEILRKKQNEILEIKNTITKMKSAVVELISRLDMAEKSTSELADKVRKNLQN